MGNCLVDSRSTQVAGSPASVFADVERIGGAAGWTCSGGWGCAVVAVILCGCK